MSKGWDPRSYLLEATAKHLRSLDVETSATTKINYFDSLSTHLKHTATHEQIFQDCERQVVPGDVLQIQGVAMCVPYHIILPKESNLEKATALIENVFEECKRIFSPFEPESEISRINHRTEVGPMEVSPAMYKVLLKVQELYELTDGVFDPTWSAVDRVWENSLKGQNGRRPTAEELSPFLSCAGWGTSFSVSTSVRNTLVKLHPNSVLDLCSLAKGWCVDRLTEAFREQMSLSSSCVEWGGDARAIGAHPSGRPWVIPILRPPSLKDLFSAWERAPEEDKSSSLQQLNIPYQHAILCSDDKAVATSGDYRQLRKFGYYHLFDAKKGKPMQVSDSGIASATAVTNGSCMIADALATCLILMKDKVHTLDFIIQKCRPNSLMKNYYLFIRNHDTWIHDETDVGLSGDYRRRDELVQARESNSAVLGALLQADNNNNNDSARGLMKGVGTTYSIAVIHSNADVFHACVLSSVVASSTLQYVTFNVMKASVLYNGVRATGTKFCLHIMTTQDLEEAVNTKDFGGDWIRSVQVTSKLEFPNVHIISTLQHNAHVCEVAFLEDAGDHIFVVANVLWRGNNGGVDRPPLVYCGREFYEPVIGKEPPNTPHTLTSPIGIITAFHPQSGPIGMPCMGLRCCSLKPLMVSFMVKPNCASNSIFWGGEKPTSRAECRLHILTGEKDWFADRQGDLGYIPFPAFQKIPNVLTAMSVVVTEKLRVRANGVVNTKSQPFPETDESQYDLWLLGYVEESNMEKTTPSITGVAAMAQLNSEMCVFKPCN